MNETEKTTDNDQCNEPHGPERLLMPKPKASLAEVLAALLVQPEHATVIFEKLVKQAETRADELCSTVCKTMDDAHDVIKILPYESRKKMIEVAIEWTTSMVKDLETEAAALSKPAESA